MAPYRVPRIVPVTNAPAGRRARPLDREAAASRISAFVYGNILVTAALVTLVPADLRHSHALLVVAGTGLSTFVAHVLAETVGARARSDEALGWDSLRHEARHALPVVSSTAIPVGVLALALPGWIDASWALGGALAATLLRLASLGWLVTHLRGEPASWRTFTAGVVLAALAGATALLKAVLTH